MRRIAVMVSTMSLLCGIALVSAPVQAGPPAAAPAAAPAPIAVGASTPAPEPARAPSRTVFLTFDDGPSATWTPRYLDALKKYGAKATFFATGQHVKALSRISRLLRRDTFRQRLVDAASSEEFFAVLSEAESS